MAFKEKEAKEAEQFIRQRPSSSDAGTETPLPPTQSPSSTASNPNKDLASLLLVLEETFGDVLILLRHDIIESNVTPSSTHMPCESPSLTPHRFLMQSPMHHHKVTGTNEMQIRARENVHIYVSNKPLPLDTLRTIQPSLLLLCCRQPVFNYPCR